MGLNDLVEIGPEFETNSTIFPLSYIAGAVEGCLMFNCKHWRLLLVAMAVLGLAIIAWPQSKPAVEVWAIGSDQNRIYHCPGSRWFGVGEGKKMGECQAMHEGYRPAFGKGCGSTCLRASRLATRGPALACTDEPAGTNERIL